MSTQLASVTTALRFGQFRLIWSGLALSTIGGQIQLFAVGWLAVQLAVHEGQPQLAPFYIGLVGIARGVPSLAFTLVGGVLADRLERRMLLIVSRIGGAVFAVGLAALVISEHVNIAILMAFTLVTALTEGLDLPARTAMVARILPSDALASAQGLTNITYSGGFIFGPLIGGVLIGPLGVGGLMVVKALCYVGAVALLFGIERMPPSLLVPRNVLGSLAEGLRFVTQEPVLRVAVVLSVVSGLFGRPFNNLLPAVAQNTLHVGAAELSYLLAAGGAGSLIGSLLAASLGGIQRRLVVLSAAMILWGATQFTFSLQSELVPAIVFAGLPNIPWFVFAVVGQVVFQVQSPDHLRGRASSVYAVTASGVTSLGVLLLGTLGSLLTVSTAIAIAGIAILISGIGALAWVTSARGPLEVGISPLAPGAAAEAGE